MNKQKKTLDDIFHPRYYIDERGGCIAVRDSLNTDPDDNGLHEYTQGVVWYRSGRQIEENCPTCSHPIAKHWIVLYEDRIAAQKECDRLNKENEQIDRIMAT